MKKQTKIINSKMKVINSKLLLIKDLSLDNKKIMFKKRKSSKRLRRIYLNISKQLPLINKQINYKRTNKRNLLVRFCVRLTNLIAKNSSKSNGERLLIKIFKELRKRNIVPKNYLITTLSNNLPTLGVARAFSGRRKVIYPIYLNLDRSTFFFVSWIRGSLKVRKELPGYVRIVDDLVSLNNQQGNLHLKKEALKMQVTEALPFINFKSRYKAGKK